VLVLTLPAALAALAAPFCNTCSSELVKFPLARGLPAEREVCLAGFNQTDGFVTLEGDTWLLLLD
jgi:hypothetical protein